MLENVVIPTLQKSIFAQLAFCLSCFLQAKNTAQHFLQDFLQDFVFTKFIDSLSFYFVKTLFFYEIKKITSHFSIIKKDKLFFHFLPFSKTKNNT